jgi:hypothetical protein
MVNKKSTRAKKREKHALQQPKGEFKHSKLDTEEIEQLLEEDEEEIEEVQQSGKKPQKQQPDESGILSEELKQQISGNSEYQTSSIPAVLPAKKKKKRQGEEDFDSDLDEDEVDLRKRERAAKLTPKQKKRLKVLLQRQQKETKREQLYQELQSLQMPTEHYNLMQSSGRLGQVRTRNSCTNYLLDSVANSLAILSFHFSERFKEAETLESIERGQIGSCSFRSYRFIVQESGNQSR